MLQIDDNAVDALKQIGTIRSSAEEVDGDVEVSIERDGARVFLAPEAADVLADQVLGVHSHGDHFHFTFDDQSV